MLAVLLMLALSFSVGNALGTHQYDVKLFAGLLIGGALVRAGMKYQSNTALAILDPTDLSWHGKEAQDISEAVYEAVFTTPRLADIHQVRTGIKAKTQIPFLGKLGLVGKKKANCDTTANPGGITMSEKFWDPEYVSDRFEECWATLKESFFIWGLAEGIKKEDLTDSDFAIFLEGRLASAVMEAIIRIAHFGNKSEDTVANSGNITNGTDIDYFNILDGMWPQLITIATNDTNRRVTIAKNSGNSYANQTFSGTDTTNKVAETCFQDLLYNSDFRLRDSGNLVILCTQSLFDQYAKELRSRNIDASFSRIEAGYKTLQFEGIQVIAISFWDTLIRTYFDTGTAWYLPHRAVITTKENIPIGVENEGSLSELDPFYDKKSKKYIVDFGWMLDMKVLEGYKVQVAY